MAKRNKKSVQLQVKQVRIERRGRFYLVGVAANGRYVSWKKESPTAEIPKLSSLVSNGIDQSA